MAQIVKYTAQQPLVADAIPYKELNVDPLARVLQSVGGAVGNLAEVAERKKQQHENFKTEAAYRTFQLEQAHQLNEDADSMAPDGEAFHDTFMRERYMPARDKFLQSVPERLRPKFEALLNDDGPDTAEWSIKSAERESARRQGWYTEEIGKTKESLATAIAQDPEGYDKLLKLGQDEINSSGLTTEAKQKQLAEWENMAQIAYANRMIELDPEGLMRDLGADPRHLSPTTQFDMIRQSQITQESGGDPNAVSPKGAIGLRQIMPETAVEIARELGDKAFPGAGATDAQIRSYLSNPRVSNRYGDHYLKKMIRLYSRKGGLEAALIAYNGGGKRAEAWIRSGFDDSVIPKESRDYYKAIMARLPGRTATGQSDPKNVRLDFGGRRGISDREAESQVNPELTNRVKSSFAALGLDRVKITSGFRSEQHNREVGGVEGSQHVHGNAMDIDVSGYSRAERVQIIRTLSANGITGIGVGNNIIHADLGARRAWGYKTSAGGGDVPGWAKAAIDEHLAGRSSVPSGAGVGMSGRFASLPYDKRQQLIANADQVVTQRYNEQAKATALERVQLSSQMDNELASLRNSGQSTGALDEGAISTVLGEDDYYKWVNQKALAQRIYNQRSGISTMTLNEMNDRLEDNQPVEGSPTYAADVQVRDAVQKEVDRVTRLRATAPDKAAMEFKDVANAYEKVKGGLEGNNLDPTDAQAFVELMLQRQKQDFNLKPGSEAPVPREWALQIGHDISSRVPKLGKDVKATDVTLAVMVLYDSWKKYFGEYTDEVLIYALSEYSGMGKESAAYVTQLMQSIQSGGDPFKKVRNMEDREQVESTTDDEMGWGEWLGTFFRGEQLPEGERDIDPGEPEIDANVGDDNPTPESVNRMVGTLNGLTEEEEAALAAKYPQTYAAAKRKTGGGSSDDE